MTKPLRGVLVVGQSGGPTPVINASLAGVIREAQSHKCFTGIYGLIHGIEGALKEELCDLGCETAAELDLLAHTPASALGSCRHKLEEDDCERILDVFRTHDVRHFIYIGGNDSMDTCHHIAELAAINEYEIQVIGVPKTIDNDLAYTDHCPGYGSAARFLVMATRDTGRDLESMATFDDVIILEAMGRNTGWLTAAAALAKVQTTPAAFPEDEAPHLVYVPEIPFDEERFIYDIARIHARLGRVFVVVSEGIRDTAGKFIGQQKVVDRYRDAFGHLVHSLTTGIAAYLTDLVREKLTLQARFLRPGLIGRAMSSCVSETDWQEAMRVGVEAVTLLGNGQSGVMVTLERLSDAPYRCRLGVAPLADVANAEKLMPREFINDDGNMITQSFIEYALPLVDGPLPLLARLKVERIPRRTNLQN
jgi:6-phosphofructokinase